MNILDHYNKLTFDKFKDPAWLELVPDLIESIENVKDRSLIDVIYQCPDIRYPMEKLTNILLFYQILHNIYNGRYAVIEIQCSGTACRNKDKQDNNDILKALPKPFHGVFEPSSDDDGSLSFDTDIQAVRYSPAGSGKGVTIAPRCVPLEVGYTQGYRTIDHIEKYGGVARFPYNYDHVTCIFKLEE